MSTPDQQVAIDRCPDEFKLLRHTLNLALAKAICDDESSINGGLPFESQKDLAIAEMMGSPAGLAHLAIAAIQASLVMPPIDKRITLLDAIVILAGMHIYSQRNDVHAD
jgi:hypothetical protein